MFAVIYRFYLKSNREIEYQELWRHVANYFKEYRGALGSCLHRTENGLWIAYSRWPNKAMRDTSWPGENVPSDELPSEIRSAIFQMKDCVDLDQEFEEICMEVVDDLLIERGAVQLTPTGLAI